MLAILADIHGNAPALEAVVTAMPEVKEAWILGDTLGELPAGSAGIAMDGFGGTACYALIDEQKAAKEAGRAVSEVPPELWREAEQKWDGSEYRPVLFENQ